MPTVTLDGNNVKLGDTYISQGNPGTNYGSNTGLSVGNSGASGTTANRALLKFDLGLIPNDAIINSATLTLTSSNNTGRTVNVHKVTNNWDPTTVVWNSNITFDPAVVASKLINNSSTSYPIDVKTLVQEWVNGVANNGFLIKDSTETGASTAFSFYSHEGGAAGQRPTLTIDYTIPSTGKKQVEYAGAGAAQEASGATITLPLPTGLTPGDLMVAVIHSVSPPDLPAGWTNVALYSQNSQSKYRLAYKYYQAGDTGVTFTGLTGGTVGRVSAFRNVKRVADIQARELTATTYAPLSYTTTVDKSMFVIINTISGNPTITYPKSYVEANLTNSTATGRSLETLYKYMHDDKDQTTAEMSTILSGTSWYGGCTLMVLEPIVNNPPTLTLSSPADNQTLTEGSTYKLEGTVSDADAGQALSVKYSIGGGPTQTIALGTSDGTTAKSFSKTLTYSAGRFWDGSTDVSGLLPAETSSIQIWANDGSDDSAKVTRNFTIQQEDGKQYVPVNVVSQSYLVSQMARPVRLSNGWLVGAVRNSSNNHVYLYVSKDNGKSWLFVSSSAYSIIQFALASKGTTVYVLGNDPGYSNLSMSILNIATYPLGFDGFSNNLNIDSGQDSWGSGIAMAITPDGTKLWWAASTKNSSYPNSFNIRAGYIPILSDGALGAPSGVTQITTSNTSGSNFLNTKLITNQNGVPFIFSFFTTGGTVFNLYTHTIESSAWKERNIYSFSAYSQSSLDAIKTPNGKMHLTWHGTDSSDTVNPYIRYSSSADGTTWLAAPRKLVKGQNASITSDKNGKLIITYEDGGYIKRIESTNEFASYSGPFTVGAGTKPATFYDQSFQTDFTVPPTFYQVSGAVKYYGVLNLNKKPVVTLTTPDNQTLTENATLSVAGSTLDGDPGNVVTTWYKINSGPARALQSGISDGSTPISFARTLTYSAKRMYDGAVDVAGADLAENTDHTLTVWAEDDKGGKSAEVTRNLRVVWNRPPTISDENRDLGIMEAPPSVTYTVTEPEGNAFTVAEKINGQVIRTFAGVAGQQETITIPHELWIRLEPGVQHALTIEASDDQGMMSTRTYTLTRFVDKIVFSMDYATMSPETKDFFTTDVAAKRLLLTPIWNLPPGATLLVEVCNNAYDAAPTWEDATIVVKLNRAHLFANESKTAEQWGINFRIKIEKGTAIGPIYVKGIGGAFD